LRKRIKDLVNIQIGYQFREKLDITSDGDYQVVQAKDIDCYKNHRLDPSNLYSVTPKRDAKKYEIRNGDVIFLSKGRRNYATFIDSLSDDSQTIVAGYFFILRTKNQAVLPEYLVWSINQPPSQNYLQRVARGSGMPFVSKDAFNNLEIDIPPIEVQKLIIKLHELSQKESDLLDHIKQKRTDLLRGICLKAAKTNTGVEYAKYNDKKWN